MDINDKIEVMQHYADGGDVEYCAYASPHNGSWFDCDEPRWDWESGNYRIKEQPKSLEDEVDGIYERDQSDAKDTADIITEILDKRYIRKD